MWNINIVWFSSNKLFQPVQFGSVFLSETEPWTVLLPYSVSSLINLFCLIVGSPEVLKGEFDHNCHMFAEDNESHFETEATVSCVALTDNNCLVWNSRTLFEFDFIHCYIVSSINWFCITNSEAHRHWQR